jgi:hypothetical protein
MNKRAQTRRSEELLAFFLVAGYLFISYVRLLEIIPGLAPLRLMLWMSLLALIISLVQWSTKPRRKRVALDAPQIVMTVVFVIVAIMWALRTGGWGDFFGAISAMQIVLGAFLMTVMNLDSIKRIRIIMFLMALSAVVMAVQGIAAFHYGYDGDTYLLQNVDEDGNPRPPQIGEDGQPIIEAPRVRNIGFLNDPNDLAQSLATFFVMLYFFWAKDAKLRNYLLLLPCGALIMYAIYLTRSRGGLVSVAVMSLLALRERLGKVMAAVLTGFMIAGALAINITGGRAMKDESAEARIEAWASGILMLREHPLFGIGFRNFAEEHGGLTAHNSYVLCFSEMGLVGYFCWMSLLVVSFIQLTRLKNLPGNAPEVVEIRRMAGNLRLAFSTFLTAAFFLSRTYILTLYLLIGLSLCLADVARRQGYQIGKLTPRMWSKQTLIWQFTSIAVVWLAVKVNGM